MYALVVHIQVKPEHRKAFIEAVLDDARSSVATEPGCVRFDVLQDESDPNQLHLYEVYQDRAAFEVHLQMPHLVRLRETVEDWYAEPSVVYRTSNIFPTNDSWK